MLNDYKNNRRVDNAMHFGENGGRKRNKEEIKMKNLDQPQAKMHVNGNHEGLRSKLLDNEKDMEEIEVIKEEQVVRTLDLQESEIVVACSQSHYIKDCSNIEEDDKFNNEEMETIMKNEVLY